MLTRRALRQKVVDAHAEQKILVGAPADEIRRICPGGGRVLGAGAVLRLGGSTLGGYGEADINYAYRQLSRALHPDKNPDIPEAPDAFRRLSEAADELRAGLTEARNVLKAICATMGRAATPEMLERPQEALFAEATRMLHAVLALACEGEVPTVALSRSIPAFTTSASFGSCQAQVLLSEWFDQPRLLGLFASSSLRTAYDCAPKRYRAQFLCALNRATLSEARRHNDCVRGNWQEVMMQFPEICLWRDLRDKMRMRVCTVESDAGARPRRGSMWDDEEGQRTSAWAATWRERIRNVLPLNTDGAVLGTDHEVRVVAAALWRDIAEWVRKEPDGERQLNLLTAELDPAKEVQDEWAFVPLADIFLLVAEAIVGFSAEGIMAEARPGHERLCAADALADKKPVYKEAEKKDEKDKDKDRDDDKDKDRDRRRRRGGDDEEDRKNDPDFNWEQVWRSRLQSNKRRPRSPNTRRSVSPRRRSRSRDRRRSRSRRRDRERKRRSYSRSL